MHIYQPPEAAQKGNGRLAQKPSVFLIQVQFSVRVTVSSMIGSPQLLCL